MTTIRWEATVPEGIEDPLHIAEWALDTLRNSTEYPVFTIDHGDRSERVDLGELRLTQELGEFHQRIDQAIGQDIRSRAILAGELNHHLRRLKGVVPDDAYYHVQQRIFVDLLNVPGPMAADQINRTQALEERREGFREGFKGAVTDLTTEREFWDERDVVIASARIEATPGRNDIWGASAGMEKVVFSYYPDELSFTADEFTGKTVGQARDLFRRRDVAYLQSP